MTPRRLRVPSGVVYTGWRTMAFKFAQTSNDHQYCLADFPLFLRSVPISVTDDAAFVGTYHHTPNKIPPVPVPMSYGFTSYKYKYTLSSPSFFTKTGHPRPSPMMTVWDDLIQTQSLGV